MEIKLVIRKCKECSKCKIIKPLTEFGNKISSSTGIRNDCNSCVNSYNVEYRNTFDGFFVNLLNDARKSSRKRKRKGKIEKAVFDINYDFLISLWEKQQGKCFYSSISMECKSNSNWKCSIERLNPDKGYIKTNVALVCHEFNNKCQWNMDKINSVVRVIRKIDETIEKELEYIKGEINRKSIKKAKRIAEKKIIDGREYYKCVKCEVFKLESDFGRKNRTECKTCINEYSKKYRRTPRGKLMGLLGKARTRNKSMNKAGRINDLFNLTFNYLVEILIKQKGLCAYSEIKLNYGSYLEENWTVSLERINPLKGYIKGNVCLVCLEFNGTDHSSDLKYSNGGSGAWSREKFNFFLKHIKN